MKNKLRIIHLNASSAGGAYVAAQRLSDALNQHEHVHSEHLVFEGHSGGHILWATNWIKKKIAFLLHAFEKLDFLRFEKSKSIRFAFSHAPIGVNLSSHYLIQKADVIHLHWVNKGFLSLNQIQKLIDTGKQIVWTSHDVWPFTGGCYHPRGCDHYTHGCGQCHYLKQPGLHDLSERVFKQKQQIWGNGNINFVTPSRWLAQTASHSSMLKCPSEKITVIPNGVNTQFFVPALREEKAKVRQKFNLPVDTRVLLFSAANLTNVAKGFAEFLQLCDGLLQQGIRVSALVTGDKREQEFTSTVEVNYLGFLSTTEQLRDAYWASDLYVTTSHEENLPTTIMESLSCGVPVAAFKVGGIPEMIVDEETGVLAEPLNVVELMNKVALFIDQSIDNQTIVTGEKCKKFAEENYSDAVIAKEYLKIYCK